MMKPLIWVLTILYKYQLTDHMQFSYPQMVYQNLSSFTQINRNLLPNSSQLLRRTLHR